MRGRGAVFQYFFSVFIFTLMQANSVFAASDEYLKYNEPQPVASSALSSIAYVVSLLVVFAVVIVLAYATSRFLGERMGRMNATADNRIVFTMVLGQNKSLQVVEIAGKFLVLGVTDHNITLLQEITSPEEIAKLRQVSAHTAEPAQFEQIFSQQLYSLKQISKKFPNTFRSNVAEADKEEKR
jgi:flagellar biosynthetic protein FliO